ncbi:MAG: DUF5329 family protein [Deltaproteobacteria bacterium]
MIRVSIFLLFAALDDAATSLHLKWDAKADEVRTALDFIDKVASISGTSGKPYLIRFKGGREILSHDFLVSELKKLDTWSMSEAA